MNQQILSIFLTLITATFLQADFDTRVYTCPKIPPRSVLDRLNLKLSWATRVPTELQKDGLASFQVLPHNNGDEVLIQTRRGLIQLMDAENGDVKWRSPVGDPKDAIFAAAHNDHSIFVTRRNFLYALNRKTGRHRLFSVDKRTGAALLGFRLPKMPSAPPIADDVVVFIPAVNRVTAYFMPLFEDNQLNLPAVRPSSGLPDATIKGSKMPDGFFWNQLLIGVTISKPLVISAERIGAIGDEGTFLSLDKFKADEQIKTQIVQSFRLQGPTSVGMNGFKDKAYIGGDDRIVYAVNLFSGALIWRYLAGAPISRPPQPTKDDVFVTAKRKGLVRLDRDSGRLKWLNPEADKFLAVNQRFVYATDFRGFLLVLDYVRGRTLARYNIRDFVVPISNRFTDRLYLAAHDGTVVCVHLRENASPYRPTPLPKPKKNGAEKVGN